MSKSCPKCGEAKSDDQYGKCSGRRDGLQFWCKPCAKLMAAEYYDATKDARKASTARYVAENPERRWETVKKSRDATDVWGNYVAGWKRQSGDVAKRRAAKDNRTPAWLTKDDKWAMREAYSLRALRDKLTGIKWHVDHIIPLRGKRVCGLHVPNNLRVIPATENLKKNNKELSCAL